MNKEKLIERLSNREYRHAYVASRIKTDLAFQIKLLREHRNWTQQDLAERLGVSQGWVAQLEDHPSYGKYSSTTLRRLASVFDVALIQRFAPFGELVTWVLNLSESTLCPKDFDNDDFEMEATRKKND